tara:strand:- start:3634 stop:4176 length:543 start_codon:yes stop_codon:yes gene_type:complete
MFHLDNIYYFIDNFNSKEILKLNKNIKIIYRNYSNKNEEKLINKIKIFCKINKRKFYIANNLEMALKLNLDGVYIPSFNKSLKVKYFKKKNFEILGSAHNFKEIKTKEKQGVDIIFIAPIFQVKKKNYFLNIIKFNLISKLTNKKLVALGGINKSNIKKIKLLNCYGLASISYVNETLRK